MASGVFEDNGLAPKCCFESFPKLSLKSFHKSDCCGLEVQLFYVSDDNSYC